MKVFSDGLQKVADSKLRAILKGMITTRFRGILTGFATTTITQSSSTTTVMVVSFVNAGLITFMESTGVIMGANIGTTVTANIAAVVGNVYAKRAVRFHFVFNVFGVIWMLILIHPFLMGIDSIMSYFIPGSGSILQTTNEVGRANATLALSLFHTTFNVINVLLLVALVPQIVRLVEKYQKEDEEADRKYRLQYISSGMMSSPELSIAQAHKEIELFAR